MVESLGMPWPGKRMIDSPPILIGGMPGMNSFDMPTYDKDTIFNTAFPGFPKDQFWNARSSKVTPEDDCEQIRKSISSYLDEFKKQSCSKDQIRPLRNLSMLVSNRSPELTGYIANYLVELNAVDLFMKALKSQILKKEELDFNDWEMISSIYFLLGELTNHEEQQQLLTSRIISGGFLQFSNILLDKRCVITSHKDNMINGQSVVYVLKVMFNCLPHVHAPKVIITIKKTADKYITSPNPYVCDLAKRISLFFELQQSQPTVNVQVNVTSVAKRTVSGLPPEHEELGTALANRFYASVADIYLCDILIGNKYQDRWDLLRSSIEGLALYSDGKIRFIDAICAANVVQTIYSLLSFDYIQDKIKQGKYKRIEKIVDNALHVLLNIARSHRKDRYLSNVDLTGILCQLANLTIANVAIKALAILAHTFTFDTNGQLDINLDFKIFISNSSFVFTDRLVIGNLIARSVIGTQLFTQLSTEYALMVTTGRSDEWSMLIAILVQFIQDNTELTKVAYNSGMVGMIKSVLKTYKYPGNISLDNTYGLLFLCVNFALCGYGKEFIDTQLLEIFYAYAVRLPSEDHLPISVWAKLLFVILHPVLENTKLPPILTADWKQNFVVLNGSVKWINETLLQYLNKTDSMSTLIQAIDDLLRSNAIVDMSEASVLNVVLLLLVLDLWDDSLVSIANIILKFIQKNNTVKQDLAILLLNILSEIVRRAKFSSQFLKYVITTVMHLKSVCTAHVFLLMCTVFISNGKQWPDGCGIDDKVLIDMFLYSTQQIRYIYINIPLTPVSAQILSNRILQEMRHFNQKGSISSMNKIDPGMMSILNVIANSHFKELEHDRINLWHLLDESDFMDLVIEVLGQKPNLQLSQTNGVIYIIATKLLEFIFNNAEYLNVQDHAEILEKVAMWTNCSDEYIQYLSLCIIGKVPLSNHLRTPLAVLDQREGIDVAIRRLDCYNLYEQASVSSDVFSPANTLQCLKGMMFDDHKRSVIFWKLGLSRILDSVEHVNPLNAKHSKSAFSLVWELSQNACVKDIMLDCQDLKQMLLNVPEKCKVDEWMAACYELYSIIPDYTDSAAYDVLIVDANKDGDMAAKLKVKLIENGQSVGTVHGTSSFTDLTNIIRASQCVLFIIGDVTSTPVKSALNLSHNLKKSSLVLITSDNSDDSWITSNILNRSIIKLNGPDAPDINSVCRLLENKLSKEFLYLSGDKEQSLKRLVTEFEAYDLTVGEIFHKDGFVGSLFDERGGYLKIPSQDVVLYLPPGAIQSGTTQRVYCYMKEHKYGEIHPGKVVLTPVIHCGPDGTSFLRDVVLSFPHSAMDEDSWNFTAVTKTTNGSWNSVTDDVLLVNGGHVFFFLDHFTGFAVEGDAKAGDTAQRRLKVGARGKYITDSSFQVNVGAWCDIESISDGETTDSVQNNSSSLWAEYRPIVVSTEDTYLSVEVKDIDDEWKQRGSSAVKFIRLANLGYDQDVYCTYTFKPGGSEKKPDDFFCTVCVRCPSHKETPYEMDIVVPRDDAMLPSNSHNRNLADLTNAELFRETNEDWNPLDHQISASGWQKICENLDVRRDGRKDWIGFAARLDLSAAQVNILEKSKSPANRLLAFYFAVAQIRGKSRMQSLKELAHIFEKMENDDARNDVIEEMVANAAEKTLHTQDCIQGDSEKENDLPSNVTKRPVLTERCVTNSNNNIPVVDDVAV